LTVKPIHANIDPETPTSLTISARKKVRMILPSFGDAYREISDLAFSARGFYNQLTQDRSSSRGINGELLSTSYFHNFLRGDPGIKKAIVIISGVHGIEGHAGHALQCRLLREKMDLGLPPDTGLILIHLVNPWGFSHQRRVDECNIDVNRGCFDDEHGNNLLYDGVRSLVEPDDITLALLAALKERVSDPEERRKFFAAAVSGQWHSPKGIFYGGETTCISGRHLQAACHDVLLSQLEQIVAIDLHTGLGPYGVGSILCPLPSNEGPEAEKTRKMFGSGVQFINAGKSVTTSVSGDFLPAMQRRLPNCDFTGVALEMGTTTVEESFPAIVIENLLHHRLDKISGVDPKLIKDAMDMFRKTFAPIDDEVWMQKLKASFDGLWNSAIQGLSS